MRTPMATIKVGVISLTKLIQLIQLIHSQASTTVRARKTGRPISQGGEIITKKQTL